MTARPRLVPLLSAAALLSLVALYAVPLLDGPGRSAWAQMGLFGLVLTSIVVRWRRAHGKREERRFWALIGTAFALWLVAELQLASDALRASGYPVDLVADVFFVSSYFAIAAASQMRPDYRQGWSRTSLTLRFSLVGAALLCGGALAYFVLVAAQHPFDAYASLTPSYVMFVCLDLLILGRFLFLTRVSSSPAWRAAYGMFALAGACWVAGDVMDLLWRAAVWDPGLGTPLDFVFFAPFFAITFAAHRQAVSEPEPEATLAEPAGAAGPNGSEGAGLLLAYALAVPVVHLVVEATGVLSDEGRIARDLTTLLLLLTLVGLAFWEQRFLGKRNDELESKVTRLALNEQTLQSQKMEALGRLAGGVAHDFNNVLMVIRGSSEMLQLKSPVAAGTGGYVASILGAVDRASALTQQLLTFSRSESRLAKVFDLGKETAASVDMLRRLIGEDVQVEAVIRGESALIEADPARISQVLFNLAANARDAMPQGGRFLLEVDERVVAAGTPGIAPGRYVVLRAVDDGKGMDVATRERIFEPFFTTRLAGVGLGLATVYGIVKQSGGFIEVQSALGQGTTVEILLPAVTGTPSESAGARREPTLGGTETVLVAEDDGEIRELMRAHLDQLGYRVLVAADGQRAISIADDHQGAIDLVITDVQMPAVSGSEVARQVRARHPNVRVLYISGHHEDELVKRDVLERDVWLIPKPFSLDRLALDVRGVLQSAR